MKEPSLSLLLSNGLQAMNLSLTKDQKDKMLQYINLLFQWNQIHNLTAVKTKEDMIIRHILDSLSVCPFLTHGTTICDVGTGAGLPGLILAIAKPEMTVVAIDSQQKKMNFVQHAVITLALSNVKPVTHRIEHYHREEPFDWIVSRAFSSLGEFLEKTAHLSNEKGMWLAMKGNILEEERAKLPENFTLLRQEDVVVPFLETKRQIVLFGKFAS